jgi:Hemerythrin HHE cation binding domain
MADVIQLIQADHQRICALLDALGDLSQHRGAARASASLARTWQQLHGLLDLHTEAEEEICFIAVFGRSAAAAAPLREAIADHEDIREAIQEADLQPFGSAAWWRPVAAIRPTASQHIARVEQGPLAAFADRAAPGVREELGRRWLAFVDARVRDHPAAYPRLRS